MKGEHVSGSHRQLAKRSAAGFLAIALMGGALAGCESLSSMNPFDTREKYKPDLTPDVPAEKLYNEGLARLQSGDTEGAAKRFGDIDKQAPLSSYSKNSVLLAAYAQFEGGKWEDAASSAQRFLARNPTGPDAAYAQYILAMSYYNQIPDVSRDQERTEKALGYMQQLLVRFPKSEYVNDVREKMLVVQDQLAGKEMTAGRFYLEKRNYTGAINRFREVVSKYQSTRHVEEALARLAEAYMALGIANEAQTAGAVLGHNFPDSPWYKDTFTLLQSGGLEPREDTGSWISRTFQGFTRIVGISR